MLKLVNVRKTYCAGNIDVEALQGVNLTFGEHEFVSILGPSGCGKTTLLNIVGGLDQYTSGDLIIQGVSTKEYKDRDWDAYRNNKIGFVFQSYNLIVHLNVLENVEMALTLSGISASKRKQRAKEVLERVGLSDQLHKKVNQLSGGQMQRVSIARALVNNPHIILADEPTGALDSKTSVQIMEILKEISKERLIIMVTHNEELANTYSSRIISLKDGAIIADTQPNEQGEAPVYDKGLKHTAMSLSAAVKLSFRNLMTKKVRTMITATAGSIGIIGVALVLAISNGFSTYMTDMQQGSLAGFPVQISKTAMDMSMTMNMPSEADQLAAFPTTKTASVYDEQKENESVHNNLITNEYVNYVKEMDPELYSSITYHYAVQMHLVGQQNNQAFPIDIDAIGWSELIGDEAFVTSQYDVIEGHYPQSANANEVVLIVDKFNRMSTSQMVALGYGSSLEEVDFSTLMNTNIRLVYNNDYYQENKGIFYANSDYQALYDAKDAQVINIVGILREKENATSPFLGTGLAYTSDLTNMVLAKEIDSDVVKAQMETANKDHDVTSGKPFSLLAASSYGSSVVSTGEEVYEQQLQKLGGTTVPSGLNIYPKDFENKQPLLSYLDAYNEGKEEVDQIKYMDMSSSIMDVMGTMVTSISVILVAFAAISLIVSSIMIGIITYVSVVERTKEIGVLRSIGARKKDISRVFNAESVLIGFTAGTIGILITYLLCQPISALAFSLSGVENIANLSYIHAIILIAISMSLTFVAGLIPASIASRKDPVNALRSE